MVAAEVGSRCRGGKGRARRRLNPLPEQGGHPEEHVSLSKGLCVSEISPSQMSEFASHDRPALTSGTAAGRGSQGARQGPPSPRCLGKSLHWGRRRWEGVMGMNPWGSSSVQPDLSGMSLGDVPRRR